MNRDAALLNALSAAKAHALSSTLCGKSDIRAIQKSVDPIYKALGKIPPQTFVSPNPSSAIRLRDHLLGLRAVPGENQAPYGFHHASASLGDRLKAHCLLLASSCQNALLAQFSTEELRSFYRMMFWDMNFQLSASIYEPARRAVLARQAELKHGHGASLSLSDLDWLTFYGAFANAGYSADHSALKLLGDFLNSGGYELHAFSSFAIVVPLPVKINRDESLRLHSDNGPALQWSDGFGLYFWGGVEVPERLAERPESITAQDILSETNAEVRRCYQEVLGSTTFAKLLDLVEIDRSMDTYGYPEILFRTAQVDHLAGGHIFFVEVSCPSTARKYMLCVPPKFTKAHDAVAWTFGKSAAQYRPIIET